MTDFEKLKAWLNEYYAREGREIEITDNLVIPLALTLLEEQRAEIANLNDEILSLTEQ